MSRLDLDIIVVLAALGAATISFVVLNRELGWITPAPARDRIIKTGLTGVFAAALINLFYDASRLVEL